MSCTVVENFTETSDGHSFALPLRLRYILPTKRFSSLSRTSRPFRPNAKLVVAYVLEQPNMNKRRLEISKSD